MFGFPRHAEANSFPTLKDFMIEEDSLPANLPSAYSFHLLPYLLLYAGLVPTSIAPARSVSVVIGSRIPQLLKLMHSF